jgi:hypothetical protein
MRGELRRKLDWRRDAARLPAPIRDELVDEAIALVVMSSKPVRDEQHLQGAFWTSIGYLLMERRAGRHDLRVGSRRRVEFEPVADILPDGSDGPADLIAAKERMATAADLMAQLDPFEQRVVSVMAAHGLGVKRAAKAMGKPVKTVLAASRSAERKLDQIAAIRAAGRMCEHRQRAIHAHAGGTAERAQETAARAHLAACASCRSSYVSLVREMRGGEFQRAASAAFLPAPALVKWIPGRWLERLTSLAGYGRAPSGAATAERTAGLLGGGGLIKAAAVTSAIAVAGAGVGAKVVHSLETTPHAPRSHHETSAHIASSAATPRAESSVPTDVPRSTQAHSASPDASHSVEHPPAPPSKDLDYLSLGAGAASGGTRPDAAIASATSTSASSGGSHSEPSTPTQTGGGASLNYLGQ